MKKVNAIISLASWEPRFRLGIYRILDRYDNPEIMKMFYFREYAKRTSNAREEIRHKTNELGIELLEHKLSFEKPNDSWRIIFDTIYKDNYDYKGTLVDITTMPRDIIWTIINFLRERKAKVSYVYHSPESYNRQWQSRDPKTPRLVYKLSGVSKLGRPTKLVLITGYDLERSKQLVNHFEPATTLIGIQQGEQFYNQELNVEKHRNEFFRQQGFELFDIDAYSEDHGLKTIERIVNPHLSNSNVMLSSLGPKLTSISLFKYHISHPETGLVYTPSAEYNTYYSKGIGETYFGEF